MEYFLTMGISVILHALKDPIMRRKFENAFLKIRDAINLSFANNPKFIPVQFTELPTDK